MRHPFTTPAAALAAVGLSLAALPAAAASSVLAVGHRVERAADHVEVTTRLVTRGFGDVAQRIPLAAPLAPSVSLTSSDVTAVRDEEGWAVALVRVRPTQPGPLEVVTRRGWDEVQADGALPLALPDVNALQRVVVSPDLAFEPDAALGLSSYIGHRVGPGIERKARRRADRMLDGKHALHRGVGAMYLHASSVPEGAQGLPGVLDGARAARRRAGAFVIGAFAALVLGLIALYRKLAEKTEIEQAEAFLERELDEFAS